MNAFCRCFLNTICADDIANRNSTAFYGIWLWSILRHRQLIYIQTSLSAISGYVHLMFICLIWCCLHAVCSFTWSFNVLFRMLCAFKVFGFLFSFFSEISNVQQDTFHLIQSLILLWSLYMLLVRWYSISSFGALWVRYPWYQLLIQVSVATECGLL